MGIRSIKTTYPFDTMLEIFLFQFKTYWRRLSTIQRGSIAITIPLLCLVLSLSAYLLIRQSSSKIERKVDHSQIILLESQKLLIEMLNAETAVRSYYIGRTHEYLQPYDSAVVHLPLIFNRLEQLVQDNPTQQQRVIQLQSLADQKLKTLQLGIQQVDALNLGKTPNPKDRGYLLPDKSTMNHFRNTLAQMDAEERALLKTRQQQLQHQRDLNLLVILLGLFISLIGVVLAVGLFRDLARDLRRGELLLQENTNLIRAVFTNVLDGVIILDFADRIEGVNQSAQKMFGYSQLELLGQNWETLLAPDSKINEQLMVLRRQNSSLMDYWQASGRRSDGEFFPIEVSVNTIKFDDRRLVIIRDITERQQAAENLQSRAEQLTKLNTSLQRTNMALSERNRELDQFAYVVSHDLKAPLRAIANLSTWIEEDLGQNLPLETQKHMQLLRGRVYRMESLLNGLLDYAQVGQIQVPTEQVDVAKLLANVIEIVAPPATFQVNLDPDMPTFSARKLLLQQVFINLIENAVDHHPTQTGTVQVSVLDQGTHYEFAVIDNGAGIDARFHNKIYNIFQTLQPRDTRERRGVGLALVKKIVETEGGTIHLESVVGEGSTFRFTWPKQFSQAYPAID